MDLAYTQLRQHHVRYVSSAPQTLPAWNPNAGGIKVFYFRDPEDHTLEIIWFPAGKVPPNGNSPPIAFFWALTIPPLWSATPRAVWYFTGMCRA